MSVCRNGRQGRVHSVMRYMIMPAGQDPTGLSEAASNRVGRTPPEFVTDGPRASRPAQGVLYRRGGPGFVHARGIHYGIISATTAGAKDSAENPGRARGHARPQGRKPGAAQTNDHASQLVPRTSRPRWHDACRGCRDHGGGCPQAGGGGGHRRRGAGLRITAAAAPACA